MGFEFSKEISEDVFGEFGYDSFENEDIIVECEFRSFINLVSESFDDIDGSIDEYLSLVHKVCRLGKVKIIEKC